MPNFFTPDRSNRPAGEMNQFGKVTELAPQRTFTRILDDGRPCVVEHAIVDDFFCDYFYFDATGLKDATIGDVAALLRSSGCSWPERVEEMPVYESARRVADAQGRDCWEFTITAPRSY